MWYWYSIVILMGTKISLRPMLSRDFTKLFCSVQRPNFNVKWLQNKCWCSKISHRERAKERQICASSCKLRTNTYKNIWKNDHRFPNSNKDSYLAQTSVIYVCECNFQSNDYFLVKTILDKRHFTQITISFKVFSLSVGRSVGRLVGRSFTIYKILCIFCFRWLRITKSNDDREFPPSALIAPRFICFSCALAIKMKLKRIARYGLVFVTISKLQILWRLMRWFSDDLMINGDEHKQSTGIQTFHKCYLHFWHLNLFPLHTHIPPDTIDDMNIFMRFSLTLLSQNITKYLTKHNKMIMSSHFIVAKLY